MDDNGEASGYLIVGETKALVIDTMNGEEDVTDVVRAITELPLIVVNTHGHCDHIGGNVYIDQPAYLHPADMELAKEHLGFIYDSIPENLKERVIEATFKPILPGEKIDIGGNELEIIDISGHTAGCIGVLDKKHRIFFTGDGIGPHIWMQLPECLSLQHLADMLGEVEKLQGEFDYILNGHIREFEKASLVRKLRDAVQEVLDGKTQDDKEYPYFGGVARTHFYDPEDLNKQVVYNL